MAGVTLDHITKKYGEVTAVNDLNIQIRDQEFLVLVGPSGCGKSTALRMVAGLEDISAGTVSIGGRVVNTVPAKQRDVAMVFQSYALYPHMTVFANMAFALQMRRLPKAEIDHRVRRAARTLGIDDLLDRKPGALSGGQRQRVAMGRAIVREPQAFLMDEPLSNLDAKLRVQMRAEISALQRQLDVTMLYVTHDQVEAMTMGDRVAVLRRGVLQQVADPQTLYDEPVNVFVAGFIGSPAMNMLLGGLERHGDDYQVRLAEDTVVPLPAEIVVRRPALASHAGREVILGIRPEDLDDAAMAGDRRACVPGTVRLTEALGSEIIAHVEVAARPAHTSETAEVAADVDPVALDPVALDRLTTDNAVVVGRFNPRSDVKPGQAVELAVDTRSLHLFDPETALAITRGGPS